jgi:arylsulfatase
MIRLPLVVFFSLFVGLTRLWGQSAPAAPPTKPNVIIILADDLGYADLSCYGSTIRTPNLDRMAADGMRLTHFYAQPQCSPSRAALLTGCYPQRVGIPWVVGPKGPDWTKDKYFVGLNPAEQTLPELLKNNGYATACVGKWHLGHYEAHLPTRHGFDQYYGLPYSNDMVSTAGPDWSDLPLMEGKRVIELNPDQSKLTQRYTDRAVAFINANRTRPFFLYLAHSMPHVPIFASKRFAGKSKHGLYADVVQELDWSVGEVMKALKKNGLDQNTFVIFTSDNGPWLRQGNYAGSAGGLREGKSTTFEGGVRVPTLVRWPGRVPGGAVSAEPTGLIDLLPTLTQLTGASPPRATIDGRSVADLLLGKSGAKNPRDITYYFAIHELQAVRKGRWKLHLPHAYEHVVIPNHDGDRSGTFESRRIELALFDLQSDPGEQTNVAGQHPDTVRELEQLALSFRDEMKRTQRPAATAQAR